MANPNGKSTRVSLQELGYLLEQELYAALPKDPVPASLITVHCGSRSYHALKHQISKFPFPVTGDVKLVRCPNSKDPYMVKISYFLTYRSEKTSAAILYDRLCIGEEK